MEINTFPLELLTNDNYADWSVKKKNNLLAQGLWDIVETCSKPPKLDDDVVEFEAWKRMNAAALHAIQSSCGMNILSRINKISSAKIAWETLAEMFMEMRLVFYNTVEQGHSYSSDTLDSGHDMPTGTGANQKVESGYSSDNQGHSNLSNSLGNGQDKQIKAKVVDLIINEGNSLSAHKSDWSVKMKNNLLAQGLWDIVGTCSKPPKPDDDVVEFEAWKEMNDAALHAIQSSCGVDILSQINKISSAKIVWKTLGKMFIESNGQDRLIQTEDDNSSSNNPGNMETNTLPLELPTRTGTNQRVENENSSENQGRSNLSNISGNRQNKLIQIEDYNSIIDEGNSSSSNSPGPERDDYAALLKAVRGGDWNATREFLELHPRALTARMTTFVGGTILHAAVDAEQEHIVVELVNMISEQDLEIIKDEPGDTALHQAAISGNYRVAKCLIGKNKKLASITNDDNYLPVALAMGNGHKELARYLYSQTPFPDLLAEEGCSGASLLNHCIYKRDLVMALELMKQHPSLAFAVDRRDASPFGELAVAIDAFESGKGRMVFWKQWIYNHYIHIPCDRADGDQVRLNIQNDQQEPIGSVGALWRRQLVSSLFNLLGFKRLYEMELVRDQFQQLLTRMCQAISTNITREDSLLIIWQAIFQAIRIGNFEFIYQILRANPDCLRMAYGSKRRSIFHCAILYRQHMIFNLLQNTKKNEALLSSRDESKNNILHMAGMLTEGSTPIDRITGAALQMQRQVQWFKEVERICPLSCKEHLNEDGLTPRQLFTKDHQKLREKGEKWMKGTATSCTMVGTLIVTIMFAAAFTIPGGNNQYTGYPILVHDKLFKLFIVTDSLSLFSSSTSVLMFLGILTSRYAEEDFLESLPRKMIIGLFALFFSFATMMIAFSTALLLMLHGQYWIVIPIIGLAGVPIILFVLMQSRLLIDMFVSTYRPGIFDRKMKP